MPAPRRRESCHLASRRSSAQGGRLAPGRCEARAQAQGLLEHDLSEVRELNGTPFRTCQPEEEEQATAFGGTLMLPRPLLLSATRRGMAPTNIAAACGVSEEMARYRYNTTGVAKQAHTRFG
jgi:hypothetical protein